MEISKKEFEAYEALRKSGIINMFFVKTGCEYSGLSEEKYKEIMKSYSELKDKYEPKKQGEE